MITKTSYVKRPTRWLEPNVWGILKTKCVIGVTLINCRKHN